MGSDNQRMSGGNSPPPPPPVPSLDNSSLSTNAAMLQQKAPQGQNANYFTQRGLGDLNVFRRTLLAN